MELQKEYLIMLKKKKKASYKKSHMKIYLIAFERSLKPNVLKSMCLFRTHDTEYRNGVTNQQPLFLTTAEMKT